MTAVTPTSPISFTRRARRAAERSENDGLTPEQRAEYAARHRATMGSRTIPDDVLAAYYQMKNDRASAQSKVG